MKKILMLTAAVLVYQVTPVLADHHKGPDHKGKMFAEKDTNGDGAISEAEFLEHAKTKFKEMDADGDGSITKEEAQKKWEEKKDKYKEMKSLKDSRTDVEREEDAIEGSSDDSSEKVAE